MRPSVRRPTKPSRTTPTRSRRARGRRPIAISSPVVSTWEMRSSVTSDGVGGGPAQPHAPAPPPARGLGAPPPLTYTAPDGAGPPPGRRRRAGELRVESPREGALGGG